MTPRLRHRLRETALTLGAVLGLICVALAVASTFFGVHVLVFRSGSMSPTIETGGAALARTVPVAEVRVGDIVSVKNSEGVRVTHRVKAIETQGKAATLTLKGDANQAVDENPARVTEVERVFWHANRLGYVVNVLGSPYALVAGGAFAMMLLFIGFSGGGRRGGGGSGAGQELHDVGPGGRRHTGEQEKGDRPSGRAPGGHLAVVTGALATAVAVLLPAAAQPTMAGFSDDAAVASGDFTVRIPPPPPPPKPPGYTCHDDTDDDDDHHGHDGHHGHDDDDDHDHDHDDDFVWLGWRHVGDGFRYQLEIKNDLGAVINTYVVSAPTSAPAGKRMGLVVPRQTRAPSNSGWRTYTFTAELRSQRTVTGELGVAILESFTETWHKRDFEWARCVRPNQ